MFQHNKESCLSKNYYAVLTSDNKSHYFNRDSQQISNLTPFTNYTITIGNYLYPEYNYTATFTTLEDGEFVIRSVPLSL